MFIISSSTSFPWFIFNPQIILFSMSLFQETDDLIFTSMQISV
jgi:hypothetical protein